MIFAIVIPVLALLALAMLFAALRRRDSRRAIGKLSRETRQRDRSKAEGAAADASEAGAADLAVAPDSAASAVSVPTAASAERKAVSTWRGDDGGAEVVEAEVVSDWTPPDPEAVGVTRRQFLNRSIIGFMGLSISGFGAAMIAQLWPAFVTGFGAVINAGTVDDIKDQIRDNNGFLKLSNGRMWITEYPESAIEKAREVYSPGELAGMEQGLVALYWKCPHLGCTVPECVSSQWFECPCHGSQYNRVGEKRGGPAPRGMDRFSMSVNDKGELLVDTGNIIQGPPIGTNTTGQEAEGPNCIGQASE